MILVKLSSGSPRNTLPVSWTAQTRAHLPADSLQYSICVQFERIIGLCLLKRLEALWLEIRRATGARVLARQAEVEKVIIVPQRGQLWHGVEGRLDKVFDGSVGEEAIHLVDRDAERVPVEDATQISWPLGLRLPCLL